jgi:hypothetical protein
VRQLTAALRREAPAEGSLLARVEGAVVLGRLSYYVYLASSALVLTGLWLSAGSFPVLHIWRGLVSPARLGLLSILAGGLGVAYLMATFAERRMVDEFTQFWHRVQPRLRLALRQAHETAAAMPPLRLPDAPARAADTSSATHAEEAAL